MLVRDYEVAVAVKADVSKRAGTWLLVHVVQAAFLHQLRGDGLSHSTIRARGRTDGCPLAGRCRGLEIIDTHCAEPLADLRDHRLWTVIASGWLGA